MQIVLAQMSATSLARDLSPSLGLLDSECLKSSTARGSRAAAAAFEKSATRG